MLLAMEPTKLDDLQNWIWKLGAVANDVFRLNGPLDVHYKTPIGYSPVVLLQAGRLYTFDLVFDGQPGLQVILDIVSAKETDSRAYLSDSVISHRQFGVGQDGRVALTYAPQQDCSIFLRLSLVAGREHWPGAEPFVVRQLIVRRADTEPIPPPENFDTFLPHWGPVRRWLHGRCKRSRRFNGLVSAIEFRLGREELVSLPQYMSLCPTGQCNALCDFCSVTINRTGIIKRQLAFGAIARMTAPAAKTVRMFGLEGNGEPTLYHQFDGLVQSLLSKQAYVYLITNASRLTNEQLSMLMGLESINISLNAATADTHRRVMKLKNFDTVIHNIRELVRRRGLQTQHPQISVSFVVTRLNIAETVDFVRFAEFDLGVDRIYVRPLSELATDTGTIEDFRDIVPYVSEIEDLREGMAEYLADTAKERRAEINFDLSSFRAMRADPIGEPVVPIGAPDSFQAPRRAYWQKTDENVTLAWTDSTTFTIEHRGGTDPSPEDKVILRSDPVPLPKKSELTFAFEAAADSGAVTVRIVAPDGGVLASKKLKTGNEMELRSYALTFKPGRQTAAKVEVLCGTGRRSATIRLRDVRTPGPITGNNLPLPPPDRWEVGVPEAKVSWKGNVQSIGWNGEPGVYLTKSYSQPCLAGTSITFPISVDVAAGTLGIGVLSEDFQNWLVTNIFASGYHDADLRILTGQNQHFQIVLYAVGDHGVEAKVDWTKSMTEPPLTRMVPAADPTESKERQTPERSGSEMGDKSYVGGTGGADNIPANASTNKPVPASRSASAVDMTTPALLDSEMERNTLSRPPQLSLGRRLARLLLGKPGFYCHKPWTDLHNFTVDGRMDVCCIATGPSQERYKLGNLLEQDFQSVWNGATARLFRATVNDSANALPPCQRCPMAYAYQGPFFDPVTTFYEVWKVFRLHSLWPIPGFRTLHMWAFIILYTPIHSLMFHGFRRKARTTVDEIRRWYEDD